MKKSYPNIVRYLIIGLLIAIALFLFRIMTFKLAEKQTSNENVIVLNKLRAVSKLVIWEQDFVVNNVITNEKKYFGSDFLKFTEKLFTTARGSIGFHIDLADSVNTEIIDSKNGVLIRAPLQLTYVSINNSTIRQIRDASIDPTIRVDKEEAVRRLSEVALQEHLKPALAQARVENLREQEKSLEKLVGKPVRIQITEMPTMEESLKWVRNRL